MSDRDSGEDLARLVAELVTTLEDLEAELDPPEDRPLRPPTPSELRLFASDVAIPGLILVLETNIRALRLLQRALRLSEGTERTRRQGAELSRRARDVSETTLERLDDALVDLQDAVEGRPNDEEAADLLADARELRSEVQTRLREYSEGAADRAREATDRGESDDGAVDITVGEPGESDAEEADGSDANDGSRTDDADDVDEAVDDVAVDVDAELESIKRELDGDRSTVEDENDGRDDSPDDQLADGMTGEDDGEPTVNGDETDAEDSTDGDDADDDVTSTADSEPPADDTPPEDD